MNQELWLWQYTDDFGKRRKTRYLLSEADALASLKDPVKVEGSLYVATPQGSTSDFLRSPKAPLKGEHVEIAWELFRLQHFPGWPRRPPGGFGAIPSGPSNKLTTPDFRAGT